MAKGLKTQARVTRKEWAHQPALNRTRSVLVTGLIHQLVWVWAVPFALPG